MDEKAAVEQRLGRAVRPDPEDVPQHVFHCFERDEADGVVEQMHRHVGEHHKARKKPQSSDHQSSRCERSRVTKTLVTGDPFLYSGAPRQGINGPPSEDTRVCWRSGIWSNHLARWLPLMMFPSGCRKARYWAF